MPLTLLSRRSLHCSVAQWTPTRFAASISSPVRFIALISPAGKRAPAAKSAMRVIDFSVVTGMMPAMMGILIPASSQRSRKS